MEYSKLLFRYPCGCVGVGKPHAPTAGSGYDSGRQVWEDALVVKVCDANYGDHGWLLPSARVLTAVAGDRPKPVTHREEEAYWSFLRDIEKKAAKWDGLRRVIRDIKEM